MSKQRSLRLAEAASIETGLALRGAAPLDPAGAHKILLASGLPNSVALQERDLPACSVSRVSDRVLLAAGDLVFLGRGEPRCSVYGGEADLVVLAAPLMRIRLRVPFIHPDFLALHLTSPNVTAELRRAMRGSGSQFISRSDLERVSVPVLPTLTQKHIASLHRLSEREADLSARLAALRRQSTNAVLAMLTKAQQLAATD